MSQECECRRAARPGVWSGVWPNDWLTVTVTQPGGGLGAYAPARTISGGSTCGRFARSDGSVSAVDGTELSSALALQSLPEPYMAVDAATRRIVMANDAMSRLVDYSPAELLTMGLADADPRR